jgi:HEAT repeats
LTATVPAPEAPAKRSRRMYVLWAIALTLLASTGLFCWLVVVPVWRVRTLTPRCHRWGYAIPDRLTRGEVIDRLGGTGSAIRQLRLYLRLPDFFATKRSKAAYVLGSCGKEAVPSLIRLLDDPEEAVAWEAAEALGEIGPDAAAAVPALEKKAAEVMKLLRDHGTCIFRNPPWLAGSAYDALRNIKGIENSVCDGKYAVLPWDTFPEFGKTKPLAFAEMTVKNGKGKIELKYRDGTNYHIDVKIIAVNEDFRFRYIFPASSPLREIRHSEIVPLRRAEGDLEIRYSNRWVRFAKRLREGKRMPYPGWNKMDPKAWGATPIVGDK